jgi:spermidine synthase
MKQLTLTFGVTAFATNTVLSAFMGGLGPGSFLAGRWFKNSRRALFIYGVLEIGVGLSALMLPMVWQGLTPIFQALYRSPIPFVDLAVWRFVLSFVSLCVPTTFMGATLPVITQGLIAQVNQVGQRVGRLYAINTLGAMLGALVSGFLLIGLIGIRATTFIAVTFNVGVGLAALWLSSRAAPIATSSPPPLASSSPITSRTEVVTRRLVMLTMFVAGFVGLAYEVVWTRVMALIFDSNVYSFAAMLTMVLLGIALGSWLISRRLDQYTNPFVALGMIELAVGICAVAWQFQVSRTFNLIAWMEATPILSTLKNSLAFPLLISCWSLLMPTTLMGMTFPLATKILTRAASAVSHNVGQIYSINVLGGVVGSFAGGFILLPLLIARASNPMASRRNGLMRHCRRRYINSSCAHSLQCAPTPSCGKRMIAS